MRLSLISGNLFLLIFFSSDFMKQRSPVILAYGEFDDILGLTSATNPNLCDIRTDKSTQHGFAVPQVYPYLEAEGYFYAIQLKTNAVLYEKIENLSTCPVGRPKKKPIVLYHNFRYQVAKLEHPTQSTR